MLATSRFEVNCHKHPQRTRYFTAVRVLFVRVRQCKGACYNRKAFVSEARIDKRFIRTNERIRAREIRVIDDEGKQIGILQPYEALKLAREKNLDLVEISPTAQPPVCRIMDYGKYLYEQEKREREAKKHQKTITVKEVKFSINVDEHDYETKRNHVSRFLEEGNKVKASLRFRGREMTRQSLGRDVLQRLISDLGDRAVVESYPRTEGNTMNLMLAPSKKSEKPEKGGKGEAGSQQNAARAQAQPAPAASVRQA